MEKDKSKNYLDKDELWNEVKLYHDTDVISEKLGEMLTTLAKKLMSSRSFSGYIYNDEMTANSVYTMIKALHNNKVDLWSQKQERVLNKSALSGYKLPDNFALEEDEIIVVTPNSEGKKVIKFQIYTKVDNEFFIFSEDEKEEFADCETPVYEPKNTKVYMFDNDENSKVEAHFLRRLEKDFKGQKYVRRFVFDKDGNDVIVKRNLFAYFTVIGKNEARGKIQREDRQKHAISAYQEEEFTKFLSDNPEMAPQRVDDDTYEDFFE